MGFDEPSLTKLLEVVSKMLAELLGGVFTSYPPTFIEYSWEYVRCQFYFCYYISLTGYKPCRAFFTILSSLFMPPNLPIQMFLFVSPHPRPFLMLCAHSFFIRPTKIISTLVVGVLLGWGIGAAAMRGALAARNQVVLQSTLQKVQSRYVYLHSSRSQISV